MNKKNFLISLLTVFVQYYDYHLFGFLAARIAVHFFPDAETIVQLLNAYFIMAVAVIAKPVGAIILGKIGDIRGRSNSFKISLIGTAIASVILFITPSYTSIGLASAFILLLCRMTICACVSSGSDGVRIYIYEHISKSRQCFGVGISTFFTSAGSLTASLSAWFFTRQSMPEYSWKFAFLIGGIIGIIVLLIMKFTGFSDQAKITDNPEFNQSKNLSIAKIVKSNKSLFILSTLMIGAIGSTNQFIIIFFGTYNFGILKIIDHSLMQSYVSMAITAYMIFSIIGGYFADRFGSYRTAVSAILLIIFLAIILSFSLSKNYTNPLLFITIAATMPFIAMPSAVILKTAIPVSIRYRLFSFSHAIGSIIISAPTAFIASLIYHKTNINWLPICYFITTILVILFSLSGLLRKARQNLNQR